MCGQVSTGASEAPSPRQLGRVDCFHGLPEAWCTEGAAPAWRTRGMSNRILVDSVTWQMASEVTPQ